MVAKPIYGIISDSIFIGGSHRVPYLVFAGNGFAITQVLHFVNSLCTGVAVESTMSSQIIEKHCAKCVFFFWQEHFSCFHGGQ